MVEKKKVGRPKKINIPYQCKHIKSEKVKFDNLSIPLQIAFVFSWSMIAVLVFLTIKSFM